MKPISHPLLPTVAAAILLLIPHPGVAADRGPVLDADTPDTPVLITLPAREQTSGEEARLLSPGLLPEDARSSFDSPSSREKPGFSEPKTGKKPGLAPKDSPYTPKPLSSVTADLAEPADLTLALPTPPALPAAYASDAELWLHSRDGGWIESGFDRPVWPFCTLPTYFADRSLERFGEAHGRHLQPLCSTLEFTERIFTLPYRMAIDPPWLEVSPNYRPPSPSLEGKALDALQSIRARGIAAEGAAISLLFVIIP